MAAPQSEGKKGTPGIDIFLRVTFVCDREASRQREQTRAEMVRLEPELR